MAVRSSRQRVSAVHKINPQGWDIELRIRGVWGRTSGPAPGPFICAGRERLLSMRHGVIRIRTRAGPKPCHLRLAEASLSCSLPKSLARPRTVTPRADVKAAFGTGSARAPSTREAGAPQGRAGRREAAHRWFRHQKPAAQTQPPEGACLLGGYEGG